MFFKKPIDTPEVWNVHSVVYIPWTEIKK